MNNGIYVIYGCPTFLAQAGQAATAGPYEGLGEGSYPTDLSQLTYFCTEFANRNTTVWGGFFTTVQIFNEPEGGNFSGVANSTNFFWGTAVQFVDMSATVYAALNGTGLTRLSAGTYKMSTFNTWLSTQGSVTGKFGYECFDAVAAHPYHAAPNGTYSARGNFKTLPDGGVNGIRSTLTTYSKQNVDIYFTEYGLDGSESTGIVATFLAKTAAERKLLIIRLIMAAARSGVKNFCFWSYGGAQLVGDMVTDTTGVALGINEANLAIAGKTITSGGWYPDGREWLQFSDGTEYIN